MLDMELERFHQAQSNRSVGYDTALAEIRAGRKVSHWIWYVFPQIGGLGHSPTARAYALRDLTEACEYLRDPVLRAHYQEIVVAVGDQLTRGRPLEELMGSRIDALKLVSSLTLFRAAVETLAKEDAAFVSLAARCAATLKQTAAQGYSPCRKTLRTLLPPV